MKRVAVFIPAYEAERTIEHVIRGIAPSVYASIDRVYVQDDASNDRTHAIARELCGQYAKLEVCRNPVNLRYGGTKKKAYSRLIGEGFDIIVLMHGDGQHPPEWLPDLISPIAQGSADIVLGSRILGDPLGGGMPLYKYIGNRVLTFILNVALGNSLTDYHTGYRAYSADALGLIDYQTCADGHLISSELLVRASRIGLRIVEVPIPTLYGSDSRSMSFYASVKYGFAVIKLLASGRLNRV